MDFSKPRSRTCYLLFYTLLCLCLPVVGASPTSHANPPSTTLAALASARALVDQAVASVGASNANIRANPRLNQYIFKPKSPPPSKNFVVQPHIAQAAALVAEADIATMAADGSLDLSYNLPDGHASIIGYEGSLVGRNDAVEDTFWLASVGAEYPGSDPLNPGGDSGYTVFRNVIDYGATGNGKTDDTAAINKAISDGGRCGNGTCTTTSTKMAVVYFPPGTYLVSTPIVAWFNTQLIGSATSMPTILAAPSFVGLGVISSDVYTGTDGGAGEWYLDTANFYRAVRNMIIDIRNTNTDAVACVHWQVAQATSLENMFFMMKGADSAARGNQVGIFSENGSGGYMGDLTFYYGSIGLQCGNQQFTSRNLHMIQCTSGVSLLWDWGWTFSYLSTAGCQIGVNISAGNDPGGSLFLLDSVIQNASVAIQMPPGQSTNQTNYVHIDSLEMDGVTTAVAQDGHTLLEGSSGPTTIDSWVYGDIFNSDGNTAGSFVEGQAVAFMDVAGNGLGGGPQGSNSYFARSRNQYLNLSAGNFVNVKSKAQGNGQADDTAALNSVFASAASAGKVVYMPAGVYIVTDTVYVPPGTKIVGSCWSQIMASGSNFANMSAPLAMFQVGKPGDAGTVEIQDLLFTVRGPTAGAVLVEWNMLGDGPGTAAMWDSHYRVGGAAGTNLQSSNCPIGGTSVNSECIAASLMLHITPSASAYIENSWAWCADHDLDSQDLTQVNIYSGRGVLIEAQSPVWLYATASEHSVLYQYNLYNASSVFMGMIQTESPYWQPSPQAPAPFTSVVGLYESDPDIAGNCENIGAQSDASCYHSWAVTISYSSNITVGGAGLYSWFVDYDETCVDTQNCQQALVTTESNQDIYINNLYTIGTVQMIQPEYSSMDTIYAANHTNEVAHPYLSVVSSWVDLNGDIILSTANYSCLDEEPPDDCFIDTNNVGCDTSLSFNSISALSAAASGLPDYCLDQYALSALLNALNDAVNNYTTVDNGYDSVFSDYVTYVNDVVPNQVLNYVYYALNSSGGAQYWDCTFQNDATNQNETTQTCPLDDSYLSQNFYTVYYELKPGAEANYSAALASQAGVPYNWTQPGTKTLEDNCAFATQASSTSRTRSIVEATSTSAPTTAGTDTSTSYDLVERVTPPCQRYKKIILNFPEAKPSSEYTVPNPKDIVEQTLPMIPQLRLTIEAAQTAILTGFWNGSADDVVQTVSTAIFLFSQAIENMAQAKAEGEAEEQAEEQAFILKVLTIVFSVLPFLSAVGSIAEPLAVFGEAIALAGVASNTGLGIYETVQDPESAPLQILGILLGATDLGGEFDFANLATLRRLMTVADVAKVGEVFEDESSELDGIVQACNL